MDQPEEQSSPTHGAMSLYVLSIIVLVIGSAISAGLQVSLYSIDRLYLRILSASGTAAERKQASRLLRVLDLEHWTLIALILFNASCMMSLPILIEHIFGQLAAFIVSVTAILFLGEVIPLSLFVRHAIPICAYFVYVIWGAIIIFAPISYPMGKLLDRILGTNHELLDREELATWIEMARIDETGASTDACSHNHSSMEPCVSESVVIHSEDRIEEADDSQSSNKGSCKFSNSTPRQTERPTLREADASEGYNINKCAEKNKNNCSKIKEKSRSSHASVFEETNSNKSQYSFDLRDVEIKMLRGSMQLSADTVKDHLRTREENAFMLSSNDVLNEETISRILRSGYTRVPVYLADNRKHVIGALIADSLVKLCFANPETPPHLGDYPLREVMRLSEATSLHDAYLAFRGGVSNMAVVYNNHGIMIGLFTLTDVLAALYHANAQVKLPISEQGLRRHEKMVKLVKNMKYLSAVQGIGTLSVASTVANKVSTIQQSEYAVSPRHYITSGSTGLPTRDHSAISKDKL